MASNGPLSGVKIIELARIGPEPYAAMLLSDLGAEVIRVDWPGTPASGVPAELDMLRRSRRSVIVDLSSPAGVPTVLELVKRADILIEGFRPGVTERVGIGPDACASVNRRLVYGRMTGWGQTGPLAHSAGYGIGCIAVAGALGAIGRAGQAPGPPVYLLGDFGAGSTSLVIGVLAALWEARQSGVGQVVDAAIVDGGASLTSLLHGLLAAGKWTDRRGENLLDSGVPWYDTYATSDGEWMAVGALEPRFYNTVTQILGLPDDVAALRDDSAHWPQLRVQIAEAFAAGTRQHWTDLFEGTDACVSPVMSLRDSTTHPHNTSRETFIELGGVIQPPPAPRFSRTPAPVPQPPRRPGSDSRHILTDWGVSGIDDLISAGVVHQV